MQSSMALPYDAKGALLPAYLFREEAAAGLYTSIKDYAAFVAANADGKGILQPSTLTSMFTPITIHPDLINRMHNVFEQKYGLGFVIEQKHGNTIIGHTGNNPGYNHAFKFIPAQGDRIVVFSNGDNKSVYKSVLKEWQYGRGL